MEDSMKAKMEGIVQSIKNYIDYRHEEQRLALSKMEKKLLETTLELEKLKNLVNSLTKTGLL